MVVKATAQGSSIGVVVVKDAAELPDALDEAFSYGDEVLVEEFIDGPELTAAVADGNVYGLQFHPEKSGDVGLNILRAFCGL